MSFFFPVSLTNLPKRLIFLGVIFILIPIISYGATSFKLGIPITNLDKITESFIISKLHVNRIYPFTKKSDLLAYPFMYYKVFLNLIAVLIGIGLLSVRKWAYFLFLFFMSFLTVHALYALFISGFGVDMLWNLALTILYFIIFQFFLNKDISTPYLTLVPRSFRKKWRIEIPIEGKLKNSLGKEISLKTVDISPSGCYASLNGSVELDESYQLILLLESEWEVNATVVRLEEGNRVGLRFNYNGIRDPLKKKLKSYLESKLLPRFSKELLATIQYNNQKIDGKIINISEGGFFFASNTSINSDEKVDFQFSLFGIQFDGNGKISWINQSTNFNKPAGLGVSYLRLNHTLMYSIFLFLIRHFYTSENRDR